LSLDASGVNGRRRALLVGAPAAALLPVAGCAPAAVERFPDWPSAIAAIESLRAGWRSTGSWDLAQTLHHLAQSIEYSMQGFPEARSELFQKTVGKAAFAWFESRGWMAHSLSEPIPGAPELPREPPLPAAISRLLTAISVFQGFTMAPLKPHFAYGPLDHAQYTRAHLMHLANHWQQLQRA
jgi:hypothetical protein